MINFSKSEMKRKFKAAKSGQPFPIRRQFWETLDICPYCGHEVRRDWTGSDYKCECSKWKRDWMEPMKWHRVTQQ